MVSAWALILLCGTVIGALKPIPQRSAATFFAEGNDPLREWLRHLKFSVPPFTTNASGFELSVSELSCSGVAVLDVKSSYAPLSLKVEFSGAGVGCRLIVHYRQIAWPHLLTGSIGATLNVSNAGGQMTLTDARFGDGMPSSISVGECEVDVPKAGLSLTFAKSSLTGAVQLACRVGCHAAWGAIRPIRASDASCG